MSEKIYITKTFLPPKDEFDNYINKIWENGLVTNQGPISIEFERSIEKYLNLREKSFNYVANGTLAIQIAIRAMDIFEGEIITTPFSYVATTSAILWEKCKPVFADIDPVSFCIDVNKIEELITENTKAILAVHVFGRSCDIEGIDKIAKKHNLKVIYDAAHCFGVSYKGKSIFSYGDVSTCSFHATKLFHTIEGGGVFTNDDVLASNIKHIKAFGHDGDIHYRLGINAKASEFNAAMGMCNMKYISQIIQERKRLSNIYDNNLPNTLKCEYQTNEFDYNYSYYPILFESEEKLIESFAKLNAINIFPRRYFFPSLNKLPYIDHIYNCPISEDISKRVACLPLYYGLDEGIIIKICEVLSI